MKKHFHFLKGKIISHYHYVDNNKKHGHKGLIGYGKTSHTLIWNRHDELVKLNRKMIKNPYCPKCNRILKPRIIQGQKCWYCDICGRTWTEKNPKVESNLYESFHGVAPIRKKKGYYEPPPSELIVIGELSQINYRPVRGQHSNTEFYHQSGDTGTAKLNTNLILCTDKQGKNLYLVKKNKNSKYPIFTDRGIIG